MLKFHYYDLSGEFYNMKKGTKTLIIISSFFLSLVSVIGLSSILPPDPESPFKRVMPQSFLWIIIFIFLWIGLVKINEITDFKHKKRSLLTALFYSLCSMFGYFFKSHGTVTAIWEKNSELLSFLCFQIAYYCISYCSVLTLFFLLDKAAKPGKIQEKKKTRPLFFVIIMMLLLTAWLPWFAYLLPGITTIDSNDHISQAVGIADMYDHHPVLHTYWFRLLYITCKNIQTALTLYSVIQMLLSAAVFASCIVCIQLWFGRNLITAASLIWFSFYPIFPVYGMTMWKDIPFALLMLLIVLNLCKLVQADETEQKSLLIQNTVLFLILSLLRHNGVYIFLPTFLTLLLIYKQHRKTYLTAGIISITVYVLFQTAGLSLLNVQKGRISEGMSIPLQQIARVVTKHNDELDRDQKDTIYEYFSGQDPASLYKATLSDPIKRNFNEKLFKEKPLPFLKLWLELGSSYPLDYIESVLHNSYGYWYPEANQSAFFFGLYFGDRFGLEERPLFRSSFMDQFRDFLKNMKYYSYPAVSWLFAPGFAVWILFFAFQYCRMRKSKFWIIHIPLICLWLQMFGSPAFCEYRYVYGFFTCLPLILSCSLLPEPEDDKQ